MCLARGGGFGGAAAAAAAIKAALLVAPGGALAGVDRAVVVGVDLVEAGAEAVVAVGRRQPGEPVIIGLDLLEPGALARLQIGGRELCGELGLAAFDIAQPPLAV